MMNNRIRTRATRTDHIMSVNKDKVADVELQSSFRPTTFTNIRETVNQYEQFLAEREACNKHRLILTFAPYCSNVLFNALTEVIWHEGGSDADAPMGNKTATKCNDAIGNKQPTREQMIWNTEYSRELIGYLYHPGFDIFNNHIIRNTSFKVVNPEPQDKNKFNTIEDYQRRPDGSKVEITPRMSLDKTETRLKHLYDAPDILSFTDSINANLTEENGWFGFINVSSIDSRNSDKQIEKPDSLSISRVLNNKLRCEFIDMYPDRTLYSFSPKFNQYRNRLEYNWDICITYPADKDDQHPLVKNGLLIATVKKISGYNGHDILLFRTFTKHGLSQGDSIYLYYSAGDDKFERASVNVNVTSLGDLSKNNQEYYFYITDMTLIHDALGDGYWYDNSGNWLKNDTQINNAFNSMIFSFKRVYNGRESEYYFRKFRKLPNFKRNPALLTEDIARNKDKFNDFIQNDTNFANERYKLAFANTIYGDEVSQMTYSDDIDIENIVDNLGRPLTEVYITVIKTNRGFDKFYNGEPNNKDVEFSHCFGPVISGVNFEMGQTEFSAKKWIDKRRKLSDILTISSCDFDLEGYDNFTESLDKDDIKEGLTSDKDFFYGDLVEYNVSECRERKIADIQHRFNTYQRDFGKLGEEKTLSYQEIEGDDYDKGDFKIINTEISEALLRPEGYYYQPHYRIPLRSLGTLNQASHWTMKVKKAEPKSTSQGMMIRIQTRLEHHLAAGDIFYICDPYDESWTTFTVVYVENSTTFMFSPFIRDENGIIDEKFSNWVKLCDIFNANTEDKRYKLYRHNDEIPIYAEKVGRNNFLWRNVLRVGNSNVEGLPEYPFANGRFYIHRPIDFFLKRQDPHGYNGLYAKDLTPNDIAGKKLAESNYEYKDETMVTC